MIVHKSTLMMAVMMTMAIYLQVSSPALHAGSASGAGFRIVDGQLYVDDQLKVEDLTLVQSRLAFLYFYVPDVGLITISPQHFEGAEEAGAFRSDTLEVEIGGHQLRLRSQARLLPIDEVPAWATLDSRYSLDTTAVVWGYGDDPTVPEGWQAHVVSSRTP